MVITLPFKHSADIYCRQQYLCSTDWDFKRDRDNLNCPRSQRSSTVYQDCRSHIRALQTGAKPVRQSLSELKEAFEETTDVTPILRTFGKSLPTVLVLLLRPVPNPCNSKCFSPATGDPQTSH